MKFNNEKINLKKSVLVAAIASALLLTGCAGEDGNTGAQGTPGMQGPVGPVGPNGAQGDDGQSGENGAGNSEGVATAAYAYTTSDYAIYENEQTIFVADYFDSETPLLGDGSEDITDAIDDALEAFEEIVIASKADEATSELTHVLVLPKGEFIVNTTVNTDGLDNITITGYGINETVLDFRHSEGLTTDAVSINGGKDVEIRDFTVSEAQSNGIKATLVEGLYIAYCGAVWDELATDNGAYGLYPVQSFDVLMEHNYAYGSIDAGIYVGQSENVVVRHNVAKKNIAGIEIENTINADVYDNLAIDNSGGILVFDLPMNSSVGRFNGGFVRIFDNKMISNNTPNVGTSGTVSYVPGGTGYLNLAASNVETYHNYFKDNNTAAMEIVSYFIINDNFDDYQNDYVPMMMGGWSPNPKFNYTHDNVIERTGKNPGGKILEEDFIEGFAIIDGFMGQTPLFGYGLDRTGYNMPAVLIDGIGEYLVNEDIVVGMDGSTPVMGRAFAQLESFNAGLAQYPAEDGICFDNNIDGNSAASHNEFYGPNQGSRTAEIAGLDNGPQIGTVFPARAVDTLPQNGGFGTAPDGLPVPSFAISPLHSNSKYSCTQPRLEASSVTFRGKVYGCEGDDRASYSCSL